MSKLLRIGVLASGSGTNLQAIIDRCMDGRLAAEIAVVITNNPGAGALDRASRAGVPTFCINHRDFSQREDFDKAVVKALQDAGVELVVLAGFMRIITPTFIEAFPERIINIHPALLRLFLDYMYNSRPSITEHDFPAAQCILSTVASIQALSSCKRSYRSLPTMMPTPLLPAFSNRNTEFTLAPSS